VTEPTVGSVLELTTQVSLIVVLIAQAVAIVVAEPWNEGAILFTVGPGHGVTVGDLPALVLLLLALAVGVLSARRIRSSPTRGLG
jgi:hypothetical protein